MILFKKFPALSILALSLISFAAQAQEPNFSMYHYSPFFTNPGEIGVVQDVRLMLNYRNQSIEAGDNFTSSSLSGFYPINTGNHRLVLGANFLNDQASDFVQTNGGRRIGVENSVNKLIVCSKVI
ncbi:MAG: type IX secretion system membrane protein PorP/SprF, partial [Bacteroidota bacterium]